MVCYQCIVGNKKDLEEEREISTDQAKSFAAQAELDYFETSAQNSQGVATVLESV